MNLALRFAGWRGEWTRLAAGVEGTGFQVPSFVAELQVSRDPETCGAWICGLRNSEKHRPEILHCKVGQRSVTQLA